jgi:hypothetical protein
MRKRCKNQEKGTVPAKCVSGGCPFLDPPETVSSMNPPVYRLARTPVKQNEKGSVEKLLDG